MKSITSPRMEMAKLVLLRNMWMAFGIEKSARHMNRNFSPCQRTSLIKSKSPLKRNKCTDCEECCVWLFVSRWADWVVCACVVREYVNMWVGGFGALGLRGEWVTKNSFQLPDIDHISCIHFTQAAFWFDTNSKNHRLRNISYAIHSHTPLQTFTYSFEMQSVLWYGTGGTR